MNSMVKQPAFKLANILDIIGDLFDDIDDIGGEEDIYEEVDYFDEEEFTEGYYLY